MTAQAAKLSAVISLNRCQVGHAALVAAAPAKAYQLDPSERKLRDNNQARRRKTLGEEQFERAYTTGTSLSLERACDLALGKTNPK